VAGGKVKQAAPREDVASDTDLPQPGTFPGGEAIRQAQARAVDTLETLAVRHPDQRIMVVSHSDIIKLIVVHYLGAHLDFYQRLEVSPASISIIRLGADRPSIVRLNETCYLPSIPGTRPPKSGALRWRRKIFRPR